MFLTECRLFFRHKKIFLLCAIFMAVSMLWGIRTVWREELAAVQSTIRMIEISKYSFVFFLVLSYLYVKDNCQKGIDEVIAAANMGSFRAALYKISVLQTVNGVISVSFIIVNLLLVLNEGKGGGEYIKYVIELWTLYHILPCFLASLLGALLSGLRNERSGWTGILFFSYIFSGGFVNFLQMMSQRTQIIYKIADVFCIFARGTRRAVNYYYLIPAEANNWLRIFIWIVGVWLLLCLLFRAERKRAVVLVSSIAFATMLVAYVQPFGGAYFDDMVTGHDEWTADQTYYKKNEAVIKEPDFKVERYDIKLAIGRLLSADVIIKPDKQELEEYAFTLYHGYHICSVQDKKGNSLPYNRVGDYLYIDNETGNMDEVHISYSGYSKNFYSTSQGIWLPAYFAYYPVAGCREIFEECEYVKKEKEETSHFRLTIDAPEAIYCSLKKQASGIYEGNAEGITLLGSRFADCFSEGECRIVYSVLEFAEEDIKEYYYQTVKAENKEEQRTDIFLVPFSMYEPFYCDDTQLLTYGFTMAEDYQRYLTELEGE